MYGDSLICGKISSLAQNSYFDLNTGNFVLGGNKDGSAALSYIDGVLTIGGIPDEDTISELIAKIDAVNNQEIGGRNLFRDEDWADWGFQTTGFTAWETILRSDDMEVGKYMLSGKAYSLYNGYAAKMYYTDGTTEVILSNSALSSLSPQATEDNLITTNVGGDLTASFEITKPGFLSIVPSAAGGSSNYRMALVNVMLQKGTKATSYQPYVNHLTSALKGTTEIAGGLMMTNLLMLKSNDESIGVVAGMSGIKDDNSEGELGDGTHSEGVALWGGGSYAKALDQAQGLVTDFLELLPLLLTKTGIGSRIGCFTVLSRNAVAVENFSQTERILISTDSGFVFQNRSSTSEEYKDSILISPHTVDLSLTAANTEIPASSTSNADLKNSIVFSAAIANGVYFASIDSDLTIDVDLNRGSTEEGQYGIVDVWLTHSGADEWSSDGVYMLCENKRFYTLGHGSTIIRISGLKPSVNRMYFEGEVHLCIRFRKVVEIYAEEEYDITSSVTATVTLNKAIQFLGAESKQSIKIGSNGMILSSSDANSVVFDLSKDYTSVRMTGLPTATNKPTEAGALYDDAGVIKIV